MPFLIDARKFLVHRLSEDLIWVSAHKIHNFQYSNLLIMNTPVHRSKMRSVRYFKSKHAYFGDDSCSERHCKSCNAAFVQLMAPPLLEEASAFNYMRQLSARQQQVSSKIRYKTAVKA
ncbi:hypothetical protein EVAR_25175_1 [Eumeta japonica]|uniref:Uncharacterized protein n=1 Tax=Eumeta variegata TaxID=151549 RepID=A0A4C1VSM7_EUMVA|nr:hypothetical protein EVAR_25175_1 [Eumeta japonica]